VLDEEELAERGTTEFYREQVARLLKLAATQKTLADRVRILDMATVFQTLADRGDATVANRRDVLEKKWA